MTLAAETRHQEILDEAETSENQVLKIIELARQRTKPGSMAYIAFSVFLEQRATRVSRAQINEEIAKAREASGQKPQKVIPTELNNILFHEEGRLTIDNEYLKITAQNPQTTIPSASAAPQESAPLQSEEIERLRKTISSEARTDLTKEPKPQTPREEPPQSQAQNQDLAILFTRITGNGKGQKYRERLATQEEAAALLEKLKTNPDIVRGKGLTLAEILKDGPVHADEIEKRFNDRRRAGSKESNYKELAETATILSRQGSIRHHGFKIRRARGQRKYWALVKISPMATETKTIEEEDSREEIGPLRRNLEQVELENVRLSEANTALRKDLWLIHTRLAESAQREADEIPKRSDLNRILTLWAIAERELAETIKALEGGENKEGATVDERITVLTIRLSASEQTARAFQQQLEEEHTAVEDTARLRKTLEETQARVLELEAELRKERGEKTGRDRLSDRIRAAENKDELTRSINMLIANLEENGELTRSNLRTLLLPPLEENSSRCGDQDVQRYKRITACLLSQDEKTSPLEQVLAQIKAGPKPLKPRETPSTLNGNWWAKGRLKRDLAQEKAEEALEKLKEVVEEEMEGNNPEEQD